MLALGRVPQSMDELIQGGEGERTGLGAERVRQIKQRALGKLKAAADRGERDWPHVCGREG